MATAFQRKRSALATAPAVVLLCLAAAETGGPVGWGAPLTRHVGGYTIANWQVEEGLPQISVTSIAQTPDGYLWMGTFNGLARFDGVRFTVFDDGNTPALGESGVTQLHVDESGALWIITLAGRLVRMAKGHCQVVLDEGALVLLSGGDAPNGTNHALFLLDLHDRWHRIEQDRLLPMEGMRARDTDDTPRFLFESGGVTWVVQQGRIMRVFETSLSVLTGEGENTDRIDIIARCAARSRSGGDWLATEDGIYRLYGDRLSTRLAPLPPGVRMPMAMMEDGQGNLWGGKWGQGLFLLDAEGSWQQFSAGTGLADDFVLCLFRDLEGSLWLGTGQGGLYRIRPRVLQVWDTEDGAPSNVVMSVTQDRHGRMWFGVNGGGLHTWSGGKLKAVTEPDLLRKYPLAYSVLADRQDAVWVGLYGMTALRWQADTVASYELGGEPSLAMTPHALFEDRAGTVWLGCTHGLLRYDGGRFTRYTSQDGLSCDTVCALAEDRSGTLYIGTAGGGLNCLRLGRFTSYTERNGLADNHVASLCVDEDETVWIGTVNEGLSRFKDGRFATVSVQDGLPSNAIGTLLEDDLGNLWLGSNRGIIRVSRRALNDYLDGKQSSAAWRVFGLSEGLSTLGCSGASQPSACKARDGRLWFSTIKGVAVVDPNHLPVNPLPPSVAIEEIVMDDRVHALHAAVSQPDVPGPAESNVPASSRSTAPNGMPGSGSAPHRSASLDYVPPLSIPPRTHRLEFRFTGLSLVAPENVRFRYRLEPFDRDWIEAGTRRVAYYSGIRAGRYRFRVTACNNDGVWNQTGATLGVVVLPPWWMTWWFRALVMAGAAALVFGWNELRLNRVRRERLAQESFSRRLIASQESERQRIAGELHDGMGQDLLVIANQAQLSLSREQNSPGAAARLKDIAETARRALEQARRIAHNLRPGLLDELGLAKAVRASAEKAVQASGVSVAVVLDDVDGLLPSEFEVNLFRIAQEAMTNVLKHARASQASIALTKGPTGIRLVVEDNGRGFEPARLDSVPVERRGFGLRQMAERAKMMGGRVDLQSRPGQGTRLTVEVPLRDSRFHS